MKKLYIMFAGLALATSVQARELNFYLGDKVIENNTELTFNELEVTDGPRGTVKVKMAPDLYLGTDTYSSKISITSACTSGQTISLCAGGLCENGTSVTKTVTLQSGGKVALQFDFEGTFDSTDEIPAVVTDFTAQDGDREETRKSFTLVMNSEAGVTVIENYNSFQPVKGGIEYSVAAPTRVCLYSIVGLKVLETTVDGSGILSTSAFPAGIYVYTLEGSAARSGKIYLR